jgi:chemotaxis protein MotB
MEDENEERHEEGSPAWLTSFSDMVMLFLCFFVLLLSFARTDSQTFHSALGSVRQALGGRAAVSAGTPRTPSPSQAQLPASPAERRSSPSTAEQSAADVVAELEQFLAARGLRGQVEVSPSERGIVLRTRDQILFASAEARLKNEGLPVLAAIVELARRFHGQLAVEGHTDDRPIQNELFPSNWELSGARSASVLRYLLAAGIAPEIVHVAGYADRRPIATNDTEEGRAKNRRVEFVFEYERGAEPEAAFELGHRGLDTAAARR